MKPKKQPEPPKLFTSRLEQIINMNHPLCVLAWSIDWKVFDNKLGVLYSEDRGAPAKPTRLMVGLNYLKHTYNVSDEEVVMRFLENPYWSRPLRDGYDYFQHEFPIDPSSMTRWRQRVGEEGVEALLGELLDTAQRSGHPNSTDLKRVVVDITVQENPGRPGFPTDARLYDKMRKRLVREAQKRGIVLRQSYSRVGKQILRRQQRYGHAKQWKRARKQAKFLIYYRIFN